MLALPLHLADAVFAIAADIFGPIDEAEDVLLAGGFPSAGSDWRGAID